MDCNCAENSVVFLHFTDILQLHPLMIPQSRTAGLGSVCDSELTSTELGQKMLM